VTTLDLVLVNPGGRQNVYQALGADLAAIEPPVWAGLLASFARLQGFTVEIVDADAEGLSPDATAQRAVRSGAKLAVIVVYGHQPSASTQNMPAAGAVCSALKAAAAELSVLLVGGHVAALPERTLREEAADFTCSGEGPHTIVGLLRSLASAQPDLAAVPDLWYRDTGRPVRSRSAAPLVADLDAEIPGVAWDLLDMRRYRAHNWHCFGREGLSRQPYAAMYTTLGCPYHCSFCCIQAPFKSGERQSGLKEAVNSYRYWSPERVVAQIALLVERYGVSNLKLADEMFVLNPRHVTRICDLLIERRYDLNIWAYARVDTVREDMIDKLRAAGFRWLAFGIEAADAHVRDDVAKGFGQDEIFATLQRVRAAGIHVIGNYIFGLPEDDHASMQLTLDLALELNCEFANLYCAMAYPGSALYRLALERGWALPESWSGYSQHSVECMPLPTRHLSAAEVLRFRDAAFDSYFTGARYLEMIRARFGMDVRNHVAAMTAHKLVRRNA
jgi:radical SAM superfamily enzyme YgiQ (UPF0313 family)